MLQGVAYLLALLTTALPGEAHYLEGVRLENAAQYADAAAAFQKAHAEDEALRPFAAIRIADCMRYQGRKDDAMLAYKAAEKDFPAGPWTLLARYRQAFLLRDAKQHAEAAKLFAGVIDIKPVPWWMERDQASALDSLLATDHAKFLGFDLLNHRVQTIIYRDARLDSTRKLLASTDPHYLANAIKSLLRSGEHGEASTEMLRLFASVLNVPNGATIMQNHLLDPMGTITQLEAHLNEDWTEVLYLYTVRRLAYNKKFDEAEQALTAMQRRFPTSTETPEVHWWLARYAVDKGHNDRAQRLYASLLENFPASDRADDALFYIGYHEMQSGKKADAEKTFLRLANAYPASTYRPRVMWYAAQFHKDAGNMPLAKERLESASFNMLGDFYAHRAYEEFIKMEDTRPGHYKNLRVDGTNSIIQPYNQVLSLPELPHNITETAFAKRLRFFGSHGLDEGEWEAMYQCLLVRQHPDPELLYRLIAEAGFAHTVWQFLDIDDWGTFAGVKGNDRLRLEFPRAYWPQVSKLGAKAGIDPYLILALMKQESTFRATVVSHAGATGVMQVMPPTAQWLEKVDPEITKDHLANLKSPENSLDLGVNYLMRMVERSNGNLVYALASYNAGPGNCDKWRKQYPNLPLDEFIEKIPFSETKHYVKKVLGNYAAYRSLYPAVN